MSPRRLRVVATVATVAAATLLAGCGPAAMTSPRSPEARAINRNWWLLFWLALAVEVIVMTFVIVALVRRGRTDDAREHRPADQRFVVIGGLVLPIIILGVCAVETVRVANQLDPASAAADAPVQIRVEGEQWWWRVDYPADGVTTANEVHVPVDREVDITLVSDNVIHSIWIPELNGKQDLIPGQENHLRFTADATGTYLGKCAEFCGIQHARMEFIVVVDTADAYAAWLAANAAPAPSVPGDLAADGREILETTSCAGCHTVRGTAASGSFGPDITHVGSRWRLGAGVLPNDDEGMATWLRDTQGVKHGALMPEIDLTDHEVDALVAYLEGLR